MSSEEWKHLPLEDCMDAIIDYRGKTPRKSSFGIPLITAKIVKGGRILEPTEFIPCEDYDERMQRGIPKAGDVVITTEGPLGEVGQLDNRKLSVGQRIITLRGKADLLDNTYLKYHLMSTHVQEQLLSRETGTTVTGIKQSELRKIKLKLPPLPTQHRIAEILSSLDDKIELNRQTNATLEAIAQAIFKEWFVDFNYPGATRDLVESELGVIPKGWRVGRLGEILRLQIGGDWGKDEAFNDSTPVISLRGIDIDNLKSSGNAPEAPVRWINKSSYEKREIKNSDVLIGGSGLGPIGKSIYCDEQLNELFEYPVTHSNFCKRLRADSPWEAVFGEIFLERLYKTGDMRQFFTGTSIPNLDINSILEIKLVIPETRIISDYFELISKSKFHYLFNNECKVLSQLRDSLLPKLMNGKINLYT